MKCLFCNNDFFQSRKGQIFCSVKCKKRRWESQNREKVLKSKSLYNKTDIAKSKKKLWEEMNHDKLSKYRTEYQKRPEIRPKIRVRGMTWYYYRTATICSKCGSTNNVQHHHPKPYRVHVFKDLCLKCHREEDLKEEK